jgi:hypothetical protein
MNFRLNNNFILVEEIEVRNIMASEGLVAMVRYDSFSNLSIILGVFLIKHNEEEIKTGEKRVWETNILSNWLVSSIFSIYGIGSSNYTAASIEGNMDACLCDGNSLLLHDFMNCDSIDIVHLVKLINANDASVSKDHSAGFKMFFTSIFVNGHCCSETNT